MFDQMQALRRSQNLRFAPPASYGFATREMLCPVMAPEAGRIAREYVLFFAREPGRLPLALLGLAPGQSLYADAAGQWLAGYLPAHLRRYPFMLAEEDKAAPAVATAGAPPGARRFVMMADVSAPHFVTEGEPLFDAQGQPSEVLARAQQMLVTLQADSVHTERLTAAIAAAGLLVECTLRAAPATGKPLALQGLRMVDTQRLAALDAPTLHALHHSGALTLVHAHLFSLLNLTANPLLAPLNLSIV